MPNVFELVSTSADGIDSDMFINVSTLLDKLPEGDDVNPEDLDIYVRDGEFENNTLTLDRTNGTSLDINLNEATGWYEGE